MNLIYIAAKVIRKLMPPSIVSFLTDHQLLIKPGMGVREPARLVNRYVGFLSQEQISLAGKTILEFGYGGFFGTALEFFEHGINHIYLVDKFARPDYNKNLLLIKPEGAKKYLMATGKKIVPNSEYITVITDDINNNSAKQNIGEPDIIVSNSVLQHVDEPEQTLKTLADLTKKDGCHLHIVYLRDYFTSRPFEMLCYSQKTWKRFLNPPNNINRLRLKDYREYFERLFHEVKIRIIENDLEEFKKIKKRIKPEFLSGNDLEDSALWIAIFAKNKK